MIIRQYPSSSAGATSLQQRYSPYFHQNILSSGFHMHHRHLTHQQFTLSAIDDIISRGKKPDWLTLRQAVHQNSDILEKVLRICKAHISDPYAQRYHFWFHYAKKYLA